jgi:capsular polysaccharide biosynthesis protein
MMGARYLDILFRHWFRFALLLLGLPVAAAAASILVFPSYQASARIWVDTPSYFGSVSSAQGWNQYLTPSQNESDSLTQMVATDAFVSAVSQQLVADGAIGQADRASVEQQMRSNFLVTSAGSHLVDVQVTCTKRSVCLAILKDTITTHEDWLKRTEQTQAKVAIDFYDGQVKQASDRVSAAEDALNTYLAQHPGDRPSAADPTSVTNPHLANLIQQVQDAQAAQKDLQDKLAGIQLSSAAVNQIDQTTIRVIDPPHLVGGNLLPSGSRKSAAIVAALAVVPGIVYLVALAWLDRTIRGPKEVEAALGLNVVATIPDLRRVRV